MPVPSTMSDLSTTAGSNSPAGTEAIGNSLDNYLRATQSILRSTYALASSTIASASTTDLATADAESVQVTGTATITSLGTGFNGCKREVRFSGACTLTHSANLVLPGAANIVTAAGDILQFRCVGTGQWVCVGGSRSNSAEVIASLGYTPVNKAGDTMTGALNLPANGLVVGTTQVVTTATGVGFGTAIPARQHVVRGTNTFSLYQPTATATDGSATSGFGVGADNAGIGYCWNFSPFNLKFGTNNTETGQFNAATGALELSFGLKLTSGFTATKFTVSSSAPGALAQGEIFFRY